MNKTINLANKAMSLYIIGQIKNKDYVPFDLKITNSHITQLNNLVGKKIFKKDSLYIDSHSLWEIMQPIGHEGTHHFHDLSAEDVYIALCSIKDPYSVLDASNMNNTKTRCSIITVQLSHLKEPFMIVVEVDADLRGIIDAKINKVVTIYPKSDYETYINNYDISRVLYLKNKK